jgi:hypothetical protein
MASKFAGTCTACRRDFPAGTDILWAKGVGARHYSPAACVAALAAAPVAAPPVVAAVSMKPIADFLLAAKDRGLKFPKARFLAPGGGELRLWVTGPMSKAPGSISVTLDGKWMGRIEPSGAVMGLLSRRTDLLATLEAVADDPAKAAADYGRLMGRCGFCELPLTDDRSGASVEMGYGQRCAKRYGLPWHARGKRRDLMPLAASLVSRPALQAVQDRQKGWAD